MNKPILKDSDKINDNNILHCDGVEHDYQCDFNNVELIAKKKLKEQLVFD